MATLTTHGQSYTKEYTAWIQVKSRCLNPNNAMYAFYGGRGIECRFVTFPQFFAALGPRPSARHSVDRIDPDGHYEAGNVRWATPKTQANNRRNTRRITVAGATKTMAEWCGGSTTAAFNRANARIRLGWCPACAVTLPKTGKRPASCSH